VQQIVLEELPLIDLVVPHALVGYDAGLRGVRPTPFLHSLWNSDELHFDALAIRGAEANPHVFQSVTEVTDRGRQRE
jgi:hypothetical protein